jgi:hypothetical protein
MAKPIMDEWDWIRCGVAGWRPDTFVSIHKLQYRIMTWKSSEYIDITADIPDGEKLAKEAVEAFGASDAEFALCPPTEEIVEAVRRLLKKPRPIMNMWRWLETVGCRYWICIWVEVKNLRASILTMKSGKCVDITADIPDGEKLAKEAVEASGGSLSKSFMYPPTEEIIEAAQRLMKKRGPIMNMWRWEEFVSSKHWPDLWVEIKNMQARIFTGKFSKSVDITADIPDGEKLAKEAVEASGGSFSQPFMYPPTEEIIEAAQRLTKKETQR